MNTTGTLQSAPCPCMSDASVPPSESLNRKGLNFFLQETKKDNSSPTRRKSNAANATPMAPEEALAVTLRILQSGVMEQLHAVTLRS